LYIKLTGTGAGNVCSDCLFGGWGVKMEQGIYAPGDQPNMAQIHAADHLYDPVASSVNNTTSGDDLTYAATLYHDSECATNNVGNPGGKNTAGASNGSHSEWETRCITFVANHPQQRIHFYAITDFDGSLSGTYPDGCDRCQNQAIAGHNPHGAYVGISRVKIQTACDPNDPCSC
jgi:hypothetical protein